MANPSEDDTAQDPHRDNGASNSGSHRRVIPKMSLSELEIGNFLGKGAYAVVKEIRAVNLTQRPELDHTDAEAAERSRLASHVLRKGDARFAIKMLIPSLDEERKKVAIYCHVQEVKMLKEVSHASIIKMRAEGDGDLERGGLFIVLDRLYLTLEQHIARVWKIRKGRYSFGFSCCCGNTVKLRQLWSEQLIVGFDIASAMNYLHEHNIVHRDLKPDNIGFDVKGECKLFDFGLSRFLPTKEKSEDGTYQLTGFCGELPYMAPEVARRERYNEKADVWSFALVFWEVCALKTAFRNFSPDMFDSYVIEKGYRPSLDASWSKSLKSLFESAWSRDIRKRPSFEDIVNRIGELSSEVGVGTLFQDDSFSRHAPRQYKSQHGGIHMLTR